MKVSNLIAASVASLFVSVSLVASAGDTATVNASINVTPNCEIRNNPGKTYALNSLDLNPSIAAPVSSNGQTQVEFRCTKNSQYSVSVNDGNSISYLKLTNDPMKTIKYSFTTPVQFTGSGKGFTGIASSIRYAPIITVGHVDFKDSTAGLYQDSVVISISE